MTVRQYATALAFKQALEQRLRSSSTTGTDFGRRRQLLVFDRFLARLIRAAGDAVILKGGLVLELRLERARTTKDVDLRMMGSSSDVLERLQEAGRLDLGDYMRFETQPDDEHPEIQNEGMRYEGYRYRAECRLAGMIYGRPFGVDVAFGDPLVGEPDVFTAEDTLGFAGVAPPAIRLYPVVSHIAEKLHALTLPRARPNSRVRDLPDIALLGTTGPIEARRLRQASRAGSDARASRFLGSAVCHHGRHRRAALADTLRVDRSGLVVSGSRPAVHRGGPVGTSAVEVAVSDLSRTPKSPTSSTWSASHLTGAWRRAWQHCASAGQTTQTAPARRYRSRVGRWPIHQDRHHRRPHDGDSHHHRGSHAHSDADYLPIRASG